MKYFKGMAVQVMILKPFPEKGIKCYVDAKFTGRCNQNEVIYPRSVLYRTCYVVAYAKCLIIWTSRIQTEIALSTTEAECIVLYQYMRDILLFVGLMRDVEFILRLQWNILKVLCSIFEKQSRYTNTIKGILHSRRNVYSPRCDFDTKEQITFILWSHWISSFLDIYAASIKVGIKTVSLFKREYEITQMEHVS